MLPASFRAAEDIDFLHFTALLEGIPGGLLGIADAQVVYTFQMLANKRMSIKDTSKPQMVVKYFISFQYKQIIVRSSSSFSSFVFSFGRNGSIPQGGSSCAKFFLKGQSTHYCKFCHRMFNLRLLKKNVFC